MCGISGFISKKNITLAELKEMNDTMYHRGPDDSGEEIFESKASYNVGFAQRRLSILDLSSLGHQPMHSKDNRISVVYNGEIYNFKEIRDELKDYSFVSNCDTEVIIASYLKWGIDCINKFNGMFAIALYDRAEDCVYLIRDRIGKKPLYYEIEELSDGNNLYFASELKPLMKRSGFNKNINTGIVGRYLIQQYINAKETVFNNVYKLEPGAVLKFSITASKDKQIEISKYWDVYDVYKKMQLNPVKDYEEAKYTLKNLLRESVRRRMISDVPLGSFLSGGYDSSLITAIAQEVSDEPVKTFTIGFNEPRFNEALYAKEVANYLGTDHTERYISEEEMRDLVHSIPKYYDEPFADSSQICTMLVSELAKERVTVTLSGDGGDEFYCGYNAYETVRKAQKLDGIGALTYGVLNAPLINKLRLLEKMPLSVRVVAGNRNKNTKTQIISDGYIDAATKMTLRNDYPCLYEMEMKYDAKDWQIKRMLLDMDTYLPGDILAKVDRASMKYSLESRCPILDRDVMEYSFRLDHSMKYKDGNKKRILKDIAYDYIPKELLDRKKVGFGVPLDKWLRGPLKEELLDMCNVDFLKAQGIFDAQYTSELIHSYVEKGDLGPGTGANYSKLTWSFFVFEQWYKEYCV